MKPDAVLRGTMQQADARLRHGSNGSGFPTARPGRAGGGDPRSLPPPDHVVAEEYAGAAAPACGAVPGADGLAGQRRVAVFRGYAAGPVSRSRCRAALAGALRDRPRRAGVPAPARGQRRPRGFRRTAGHRSHRSWHLADVLERPDLPAFIAVRRINPDRQADAGAAGRAGAPVGYAKLGTTPPTRHLVRTEVQAHWRRCTAGSTPWWSRALLTAGDWRRDRVRRRRTAAGRPRPLGPRPGVDHRAAGEHRCGRERCHARPAGRVRLRGPGAGRPADVPPPTTWRRCSWRWLDRLERQPATLDFGRMHGDWIPDNLGRSAAGWSVWDWEHSSDDAPVGFDLLHWRFQRALSATVCGPR